MPETGSRVGRASCRGKGPMRAGRGRQAARAGVSERSTGVVVLTSTKPSALRRAKSMASSIPGKVLVLHHVQSICQTSLTKITRLRHLPEFAHTEFAHTTRTISFSMSQSTMGKKTHLNAPMPRLKRIFGWAVAAS